MPTTTNKELYPSHGLSRSLMLFPQSKLVITEVVGFTSAKELMFISLFCLSVFCQLTNMTHKSA